MCYQTVRRHVHEDSNLAVRVLSIAGFSVMFDWACRTPQHGAVNQSALSWFLAHLWVSLVTQTVVLQLPAHSVHWQYTFKVVKSCFYDGHYSHRHCGLRVIELSVVTLCVYPSCTDTGARNEPWFWARTGHISHQYAFR